MASLLSVEGLTVSYESNVIINDISFEVTSGEVFSIIGKSGSGKSTILNSINGMLESNSEIIRGNVSILDRYLLRNGKYTPFLKQVLGKELASINQYPDKSFDPLFKIGNQMVEILKAHEAISTLDAKKKSLELFLRLRLDDPERVWNSYPHELSGGMCQRVSVAMALANEAKLLLADEPTSAIDVTSQSEFINLMREVVAENNLAVILVTHNMHVAEALSDKISILKDGKLFESGGNTLESIKS